MFMITDDSINCTSDAMPTFTVFTPTYNRINKIKDVYRCLLNQSFYDFEWLIVDGGSDATDDYINTIIGDSPFIIRYFKQTSVGLHGAYNEGADYASGRLFVTLHSDDTIVPDALEKILFEWEAIPLLDQTSYSGIWARCCYKDGSIIGRKFPSKIVDSTYQEFVIGLNYRSELFPMVRTDIVKKFKFPNDSAYRFIPEGYIWAAIGRFFRTRYIDVGLRVYDSQSLDQQSTEKLTSPKMIKKNSGSIFLYYQSLVTNDLSIINKHPLQSIRVLCLYSYYGHLSGKGLLVQLASIRTYAKLLIVVLQPVIYCIKFLKTQ